MYNEIQWYVMYMVLLFVNQIYVYKELLIAVVVVAVDLFVVVVNAMYDDRH
jgi:hypothetical protein